MAPGAQQTMASKTYILCPGQGAQVVGMGKDFDADLHEAITEIPAPSEDMKGKILDVVQPGYYLNDKLIRHAKVVVGA